MFVSRLHSSLAHPRSPGPIYNPFPAPSPIRRGSEGAGLATRVGPCSSPSPPQTARGRIQGPGSVLGRHSPGTFGTSQREPAEAKGDRDLPGPGQYRAELSSLAAQPLSARTTSPSVVFAASTRDGERLQPVRFDRRARRHGQEADEGRGRGRRRRRVQRPPGAGVAGGVVVRGADAVEQEERAVHHVWDLDAEALRARVVELFRRFLPKRGMPTMYMAAATVHEVLKPWWMADSKPHKIADVLARRRPERDKLYALTAEDSAMDALQLMIDAHVKCVAVVGEVLPFDGIFTDTDFLAKVAATERKASSVKIGQVMTPVQRTAYVYPDNSIESCVEIMAAIRCHHLPVVTESEDALLAVVSMEEILGLTREARQAIVESSGLTKMKEWEERARGARDTGQAAS